MRGERGFVLVNALILVLAISSVSAGLLALAGTGRERLFEAQQAEQAALYLDAAETLVAGVLASDWRAGSTDHGDEAWTRPVLGARIDRGTADIRVRDLQGLLDVNRLAEPSPGDRAAFARLFEVLDLSQALLVAVEAYLAPGGPGADGYADRAEPIRPRGGPLADPGELRQVAGMTPAAYARLAPFLAALPERAPVNANTAPAEVLQSLLAAEPEEAAAFVVARDASPIEDADDLVARLTAMLGPEAVAAANDLSLGSSHFEAEIAVRLEERMERRRAIFSRDGETGHTRVSFRTAMPAPLLQAAP